MLKMRRTILPNKPIQGDGCATADLSMFSVCPINGPYSGAHYQAVAPSLSGEADTGFPIKAAEPNRG